jgi:hypothetical protein
MSSHRVADSESHEIRSPMRQQHTELGQLAATEVRRLGYRLGTSRVPLTTCIHDLPSILVDSTVPACGSRSFTEEDPWV